MEVFSSLPYSCPHTFVLAAVIFWSCCCCFLFCFVWVAVVASVEAVVLLLFAAHFGAEAGPAVVVVAVEPPAG